ncbi:MAG TPA: ATP-binding protein, partial [Chthoniobacterales bacterium]
LTASIAHEINQPLAAIVTNANAGLRWLATDTPNLEETRHAIRRIIRDGSRAGEVVASMRALFKRAPTAKEPVDIKDVIQEVLALTQSEVQRNRVSLRTQFATDLPLIIGDRTQLQQVILNLVLNAIQAMSTLMEGPRELHISSQTIFDSFDQAENSGKDRQGSIAAGQTRLLIAVRDSGPGLGSTDCNLLFKSFYTTKPEGLGMGLAISRSIVEAHGGRLWAEPNDDRGVTFHFTLPAVHHS